MAIPIINAGDPQPVDCNNCEGKFGYQQSDYIKVHFVSMFKASGAADGGFYGNSQRIINQGITCYCTNCFEPLKFKLNKS